MIEARVGLHNGGAVASAGERPVKIINATAIAIEGIVVIDVGIGLQGDGAARLGEGACAHPGGRVFVGRNVHRTFRLILFILTRPSPIRRGWHVVKGEWCVGSEDPEVPS